ncbi:hypothetical protein DCAR_0312425 [Daucus carota subsp. sativus]|uniref:Uncharacterized protein n=1 Tax=Daucus carota subsp. sativus TaxID=79200 RepID=A0A166B0F6_DAUCS|nr:hypothetical protein DCAR_0312425 [Daucus carota subsp. sativus]
MAYKISNNQQDAFLETEKLSLSGAGDDKQLGSPNSTSVTSKLYIKASSSAQTQNSSGTLDRQVVLRRIRQHKCLKKVQNTFQALLPQAASHQGWLEQDDVFTSP